MVYEIPLVTGQRTHAPNPGVLGQRTEQRCQLLHKTPSTITSSINQKSIYSKGGFQQKSSIIIFLMTFHAQGCIRDIVLTRTHFYIHMESYYKPDDRRTTILR